MNRALRVEPNGESGGHCDCCGNETRTIWGHIYAEENVAACYFLQWTRHEPSHFPNLDFLIGTWGDNAPKDRKLVAWLYNPSAASFMAIDSASRPAAKSSLCNRALSRDEVLSDSRLMDVATQMIDAVWIGDPRVQELKTRD
jgi:hypothetical protein